MTSILTLQEWLQVMRKEYLDGFVDDGGSALKFAVPVKKDLAPLLKNLFARDAKELGYLVVEVDSTDTRVHMLQEVFFRIAEQIDWRLLARLVVLKLCDDLPYQIRDIDPSSEVPILEAISAANDVPESQVALDLRRLLPAAVTQNRGMARDFRLAMTHLCITEMEGVAQNQEATPLIDWLTGVNRRVSSVRHYLIYNGIVRTNARHFLESLLYWVRYVGYSGTAVIVDDSRITLRRNPHDGLRFYARSAVMDHYELLRELIDGADRLDGLMMLVMVGDEFLDDDIRGKGFSIYQALRSRIADEVRSRTQANPLSTLVRLSDGPMAE
jgi:hypothetical protein